MMMVSSPRDLIHRSVRPGLVSPLIETSDRVGNRVEARKRLCWESRPDGPSDRSDPSAISAAGEVSGG